MRRGGPADADACADLFIRARGAAHEAGTIPPLAHAEDDVRRWFARDVARDRELWVAEEGTRLAAILVLNAGMLDELYVEPELTGNGIGSQLVAVAKRERPGGLQLWAFQANTGALRFYERHGFRAVERTDGSGNQERAPDVRFAWP